MVENKSIALRGDTAGLEERIDQMSVGAASAELLARGIRITKFYQSMASTIGSRRGAPDDHAFTIEVHCRLDATEEVVKGARVCRLATGSGSGPTIGRALAAALRDAQAKESSR